MRAKAIHRCVHVLDLEKSLEFYEKALGFTPVRTIGPDDGSWSLTFLSNGVDPFEIELTWNQGHTEPYDNGSDDTHLGLMVDDFDAAHKLHENMGCIVLENHDMGIYFIEDPDGCWLEIIPAK